MNTRLGSEQAKSKVHPQFYERIVEEAVHKIPGAQRLLQQWVAERNGLRPKRSIPDDMHKDHLRLSKP